MDLQTVLTAIESWSAQDRLRLIEEIWESLESDSEAVSLNEAHKDDSQRRLDARRDNPKAGSSWAEVKARVQGSER